MVKFIFCTLPGIGYNIPRSGLKVKLRLFGLPKAGYVVTMRNNAKKWKLILIIICCLAIFYISGPIIAGSGGIGEREGPVIYPKEFHTGLYILGYESKFHEKPRENPDSWMYKRPLFYGLSRRLKSSDEREAYIKHAMENKNPRLEILIEMNQK
jgi:hypothetical protein